MTMMQGFKNRGYLLHTRYLLTRVQEYTESFRLLLAIFIYFQDYFFIWLNQHHHQL